LGADRETVDPAAGRKCNWLCLKKKSSSNKWNLSLVVSVSDCPCVNRVGTVTSRSLDAVSAVLIDLEFVRGETFEAACQHVGPPFLAAATEDYLLDTLVLRPHGQHWRAAASFRSDKRISLMRLFWIIHFGTAPLSAEVRIWRCSEIFGGSKAVLASVPLFVGQALKRFVFLSCGVVEEQENEKGSSQREACCSYQKVNICILAALLSGGQFRLCPPGLGLWIRFIF
jgi:hypothetical protein